MTNTYSISIKRNEDDQVPAAVNYHWSVRELDNSDFGTAIDCGSAKNITLALRDAGKTFDATEIEVDLDMDDWDEDTHQHRMAILPVQLAGPLDYDRAAKIADALMAKL
jgi:hypothetical protein